jgi:glycosyltransferase involved in cell wall biosynthesis
MNERIAVVLPARDEAPTIADLVERIGAAVPSAEVWVIDDGSIDDTGARAASSGARVLRLDPNRGKGIAVRHAIDRVEADVLVFLDADGQDDPAEIPRLLDALEGADLVLGSRFLGRFEEGAITRLNRAGTRALTGILNAMHRVSLTDPIAGFRAGRSDFLRSLPLRAVRYDIEIDMVLCALRAGGVVREVPVRREPRRHGTTHLSQVRDGTRMLYRIVRARYSRGPSSE